MNDHKTLQLDKTLTIVNQRGLHARAAAKFTETISNFSCEVEVSKDKAVSYTHLTLPTTPYV